MSGQRKKILIAAGGTGGHLFPAQALADDLLEEEGAFDLLFAGAGLSGNRYFQREKYPYCEVKSATPFRRSIAALIRALVTLAQGVWESCALLEREKPDLIVGFGSFHSFPVLLAARIKKIPFILFESNAIPGRVNRLFSRWAQFTAVYFSLARSYLRGEVKEVEMPVRRKKRGYTPVEARRHFGLEADIFTLLVFGGSQGSAAINQMFTQAAKQTAQGGVFFQVIHLAGDLKTAEAARAQYAASGIPACVKEFEPEMELAYEAAGLAISRAGAATLSELIAFEVPAILIPYPHAADDHQKVNAEFFVNEVKGALHFDEKELNVERLQHALQMFLDPLDTQTQQMKRALRDFNSREKRDELSTLICKRIL